jgi:hypothetical protein
VERKPDHANIRSRSPLKHLPSSIRGARGISICLAGGAAGFDDVPLVAREQLVFGWARRSNVPVASSSRGGNMSADRLVRLHRITFEAAAQCLAGRANEVRRVLS